ncbi:MAG: hypothetical protein PHI59_07735, partial [Candidatus Omnitrophica bacterium]|nr:hypothetical protein [Candidatus Omnitrophota bacterium]
TIYRYNMADDLILIGDALGNIIDYSYDSLGRRLTMNDPDLGIRRYEYDALGNLKKCTDAKSEEIYYDYDELSRPIKKSYKSLPGGEIIYTYDGTNVTNGIGRRTAMQDISGSASWSYDVMGRVTSETKIIDGETYGAGWAYDAMGRVTSITYPNGEVVNYTYNTGGNIDNIPGYVSEIQYNALGHTTDLKFGNNLTRTLTYYPDNNRLMSIVTPSVQSLSYTYDFKGNVKSVSDVIKSYVKNYDYDDLDRMTSGDNTTYEYNSIGNITKAGSTAYAYDPAHIHALMNDGVNQYAYDDNGNMLSGTDRVISYDPENRPLSITKGSATVDFVYDGDGNRVKKVVRNGSLTKTTIYIGNLYEKEQ